MSTDPLAGKGYQMVEAIHRARELRLWGGRGRGAGCDECSRPIDATQTDFEVEAELDGGRVTLHFHRQCYDNWKASKRTDNEVLSLYELPVGV